MRKQVLMIVCALTIGLVALTPAAKAQSLFEGTGVFKNGLSSVGGNPIANGTLFSFSATFDETADLVASADDGTYRGTFTFDIAGHGIYTTAPAQDINAVFIFQSGYWVVGIADQFLNSEGFGYFSGSSNAFNVDAPTSTVFNTHFSTDSLKGLKVSLTGGAGLLSFNTFDVSTASVKVSSATPEGSSIAMLALGLVPVAGVVIKRRRRSVAAD